MYKNRKAEYDKAKADKIYEVSNICSECSIRWGKLAKHIRHHNVKRAMKEIDKITDTVNKFSKVLHDE